jgi:hypothetical protein
MQRDLTHEEDHRPSPVDMQPLARVFSARMLPDGRILFPLRRTWRPVAAFEFSFLPALLSVTYPLHNLLEAHLLSTWEIAAPIFAIYFVVFVSLIVRRSLVIRPGAPEGELRQGNVVFRSQVCRAAFYESDSARQPFFDIDEGQFWMRCRWFISKEERQVAMRALNRLLEAGGPGDDGAEESFPRPRPRSPNGGKGAFLDVLDVTELSADAVTFRSSGFSGPLIWIYFAGTMLSVIRSMLLYAWFDPGGSDLAGVRFEMVDAAVSWLIIAVLAIICRVWRPQFKVTAGKGILLTELGRRIERPYTEWEFQSNAPEEGSESRLSAHPYLTLRLRGRKPRIIRVSLRYTAGALGDLAEEMNRFLWGSAAETKNLEADTTGAWRH